MKTKEKKFKIKNKYTREQIKEIVTDVNKKEEMKKIMDDNISLKEFEIIMEIIRESRIDMLIEKLGIDYEKYVKAKNQIIKIKPKSKDYHLISVLFRNHNGLYKVEDLINEYHDDVLQEGITVGLSYGKKFVFEDIQNMRFSKSDIMNMTSNKINAYYDEEREKI